MAGGIDKLTRAVIELDRDLEELGSRANEMAGDLVSLGDMLAREVENDLDILVKQLEDEIKAELEKQIESIKAEYARRKEEQLRLARGSAEINKDKAVRAVAEEIKKLLSEV